MLSHRWMGVPFCVLFGGWFISGVVMMYCRFPRVEARDRLARAPAIDPDAIRVTPQEALARIHANTPPSGLRLNLLDGRPVYRFAFGRRSSLVFADTGEPAREISEQTALRVASAWTGFPTNQAQASVPVTRDDQWTVYSTVRPYGPFWKSSWPNGEIVYVSQRTGEVVQDTTPASRMGAYFGAIPHWLYFTWLRANAPLWTQVVIWVSAAGTAMSILGMIAGVWLYSPSKRYRFPSGASGIPYVGYKRWHLILGLTFGAVTCTWIFSGLMSMGPFSWLSDPDRPNLDRALHFGHLDLARYGAADPSEAIKRVTGGLKELEWQSFGGEAWYLAKSSPLDSRIVSLDGSVRESLDETTILEAVKRAAAPAQIAESRVVNQYEPYYIDRHHEKPLPVVYVRLNDPAQSAFYIDPRTGSVVQSYGVRSRWNRWLYHGFHSIDLPWLYAHRPAWDVVVLALMLGGTALSVTSLVIAWKVARRKLREMWPARALAPKGDVL